MNDNDDLPALANYDLSVSNYRLNEARAAARVAEFARHPAPSTLEQELALTRFLIEEATNQGSLQTASTLLTTLNKLSRTHENAAIRANELLARSVVIGISQSWLAIVTEEFRGLPGWELRFDSAAARIGAAIDSAVNPSDAIDD